MPEETDGLSTGYSKAKVVPTRQQRALQYRWSLGEETLPQRAVAWEGKRDAKGKGEKERYTNLNAEFQRIARRGKKAFLSDQCKEVDNKE